MLILCQPKRYNWPSYNGAILRGEIEIRKCQSGTKFRISLCTLGNIIEILGFGSWVSQWFLSVLQTFFVEEDTEVSLGPVSEMLPFTGTTPMSSAYKGFFLDIHNATRNAAGVIIDTVAALESEIVSSIRAHPAMKGKSNWSIFLVSYTEDKNCTSQPTWSDFVS